MASTALNSNTGFSNVFFLCITLVGLFLGAIEVSAQSYNYRFHNLSIEDGLSNSGVSNIIQDSLGYIWIATSEGLNRYDGYTFKVYKNDPLNLESIPDDNIIDLAQDSKGIIWLGSQKGGLIKFDPKRESFEHISHGGEERKVSPLAGNSISCLFIDDQDNIWIGTREIGLVKYDLSTKAFKTYSQNLENKNSISSNRVFDIIRADDENIWISTTRTGLNRFNKKSEKFETFRHSETENSISTDKLRSLFQDGNGLLWIGSTKGGLTKFDPQTGVFETYKHIEDNPNSLPSNEAYSISEDKQGRIWVGTWSQGLSIYDPSTEEFRNYWYNPSNLTSISGNIITSLFQDKLGKMWLGFDDAGLAYFDPQEQKFTRYQHNTQNKNSLSGSKIRTVFEDSYGALWIGTIGTGLNKYDRETDKFELFMHEPDNLKSLPNNTPWSIYEDVNNTLWVGTTSGLTKYNRKTNSFIRVLFNTKVSDSYRKNNILKVTGDQDGNLYLGTWGGGLNKYSPKNDLWEELPFDHEFEEGRSSNIKHLIVDKNNNLWAGIASGLAKYSIDEQVWTYFKADPVNEGTYPSVNITAIFESSKGSIWIGTDVGLYELLDDGKSFKNISVGNGLSSRWVVGIGEDTNGLLWISTSKGINSIDPQNYHIEKYLKKDGLQSEEFNEWAFAQTKERIYFGGVNGLNEFSPQHFVEDVSTPKVVLTNFLIFNKEVKIDENTPLNKSVSYSREISIDYSDYIFAFEFSAMNTRHPEHIQYAYMLDGFDKEWIYTSAQDKKAVYTNVPQGTYTFKVKATNNNGVWNKESTNINVVIIPPWWNTWWAQLLFYSVLLLIFIALYNIRTSFFRKQKIALEIQVKEKTEEIAMQNSQLEEQKTELESLNTSKDRLLSLMSHDVRTPLNSLKGLLYLFENTALSKAELKNIATDVGNQVNQITSFLENLSRWAKNQLHGTRLDRKRFDLGKAINECTNLLSTASNVKKINVLVDIQHDIFLNADEEKLKFVIRNLLSNAIKFCSPGDKIEVKAVPEKGFAKITVQDTGTGISPDQLDTVFDTHHLSLKGTSDEVGTGLGLSVCKEYVEHFGGIIGVESTLGNGSMFWFTLPVSS